MNAEKGYEVIGGEEPNPRALDSIRLCVTRIVVLVILCAVTPVGGSANFIMYEKTLALF